MRAPRTTAGALAVIAVAALAGCATEDEPSSDAPTAAASSTAADGGLATVTDGVLTIGTSDPAYEPWIVENDPTNGKGFESAVAYAVADELGFDKDHVKWVSVTFDQIIAPGEKSFDIALNQVSITDDRKASLDFSPSYYDTAQAVVTLKDTAGADASSIADLAKLKIGAMVGTTSAQVAESAIKPSGGVSIYNDNDQLKQALTAGLVDAIVVDLPTALYITGVELDGSTIVGQLPAGDNPDQFGIVLDKGSSLTAAVTTAVDALRDNGTLAELTSTWLTDSVGAPVLK